MAPTPTADVRCRERKQRRARPVKRSMFRMVTVTLIYTVGLYGLPAAPLAAAATAPPSSAPVLVVPAPPAPNRMVPSVKPAPQRPSFSFWPGAPEIAAARIFQEPLVPS